MAHTDGRDLGQVGARGGQAGREVGGDDVRIGAVAEVEAIDAGREPTTERLHDRPGDARGERGAERGAIVADGAGEGVDDGEGTEVGADQAPGQAGDDQRRQTARSRS